MERQNTMTATPLASLNVMRRITRQLGNVQLASVRISQLAGGATAVAFQVPDWDTFTTVAKAFGLDPAESRSIGPDNDTVEGAWNDLAITVFGSSDPAMNAACQHCRDKVAS